MENESVNQLTTMNLAKLPEHSKLLQLLKTCEADHQIVLTMCADGAMIMDCYDCPFKRILDSEEEEYIRKQEGGGDNSISFK